MKKEDINFGVFKTGLEECLLHHAQDLLVEDYLKGNKTRVYYDVRVFGGEENKNFFIVPSYRCALAFKAYQKLRAKRIGGIYIGRLKKDN